MTSTHQIYLLLILLALALALMWGPLRAILGGITSAFLTPTFLNTLKITMMWLIAMLKLVATAHFTVWTNLTSPHSVIFPSLDSDDDRVL